MLSEQEKREFLLSTIRPMADFTLKYLTQAVGIIDNQSGEHLGTGIFCETPAGHVIVTAKHVLDIDKAEPAGRFQGISFTRGAGERPAAAFGVIASAEESDVAVYQPDHDFPIGESMAYWPATRFDPDRSILTRDYLFIQGFPRRFSRPTTLGGPALASESLAYGAMMRLSEDDIPPDDRARFAQENPDEPLLPSGWLKPHQFAVNFSTTPASFLDDQGNPESRMGHIQDWSELFEPAGDHETLPGQRQRGAFGLSGSPVWRIGIAGSSREAWTPESSRLVGIVTDWNADRRVLIATSIAYVEDIIEDIIAQARRGQDPT